MSLEKIEADRITSLTRAILRASNLEQYLEEAKWINYTYFQLKKEFLENHQSAKKSNETVSLTIMRDDGVRFVYDRFSPNGTEINFLTAYTDFWASVPVGRFETAVEALKASESFVIPTFGQAPGYWEAITNNGRHMAVQGQGQT